MFCSLDIGICNLFEISPSESPPRGWGPGLVLGVWDFINLSISKQLAPVSAKPLNSDPRKVGSRTGPKDQVFDVEQKRQSHNCDSAFLSCWDDIFSL